MAHDNSIQTYKEEELKLNKRELQIYRFFKHNRHSSYNDKQIGEYLGYSHHSSVQPRISDLIKKKHLKEVGKERCKITGKPVRLVKFDAHEDQMELPI